VREPQWNERRTASYRENAGVYRLLCVNVNGMRQLETNRRVLGSGAETWRLLCVNVLKTQGRGIGGSTLRSGVRQGSALRSDRYATREGRAALTAASAAGVAGHEEHVCSSVLKRTGVRLRSHRAAWAGPAAAR
jgi:hypothetical protein